MIRNHLKNEERCQIYALLKEGYSKRKVARCLKRSHSTIVREVCRNKGACGYRYKQAHDKARKRRFHACQRPHKMTLPVIKHIICMLQGTQASPVQISGRLKHEGKKTVSHETIYRFLWKDKTQGGRLYQNLRHQGKKYNKRYGKQAGRGMIPGRVDIEHRPEIVEKKLRFGDFELDTIVGAGQQGAIVSIVDRATKFTWLRLVKRRTSELVSQALCESMGRLKGHIHTLTSDNGKEFADHQNIVRRIGGKFYFAKPYHSWERGLNEHTNGLVRQYFRKGTNFCKIAMSDVLRVQHVLNHRPRKALHFKTPAGGCRSSMSQSTKWCFSLLNGPNLKK